MAKTDCEHKFIHLETKKTRAERPSWGFSSAVDWQRIDVFFCEKCLEYKTVKKTENWMLNQPEWW